MRKRTMVLAFILVMLAGIYAVAADEAKDYGVGQTRTIELTETARVGTALLAPGTYKVTHLMEGGNHVLVFKDRSKKEVARVNCTMVELPAKAGQNTQDYSRKGNERVLSGLTFNGDKFSHQF